MLPGRATRYDHQNITLARLYVSYRDDHLGCENITFRRALKINCGAAAQTCTKRACTDQAIFQTERLDSGLGTPLCDFLSSHVSIDILVGGVDSRALVLV